MNLKSIATVGVLLLSQFTYAQGSSDESFEKAFGMNAQQSASLNIQPNIYHHSLNIAPLTALLGGLSGKYDYFVTPKTSVCLGGSYYKNKSISSDSTSSVSYGGYLFSYSEWYLGSTHMLSGDLSVDGVYLQPSIGMMTSQISNFSYDNLSASLTAPIARAMLGYQWINTSNPIRFAIAGGTTLLGSDDVVVLDSYTALSFSWTPKVG